MLKVIGGEQEGEFKAVASGTLPNGKPVVVNSDGTVSVVSETSVTEAVGTAVTYDATTAGENEVVYDSNAQKIVVTYRDTADSNRGHAVVGTVNASNNSISFGTPVQFTSTNVEWSDATYDSVNNKVVIAYANSQGSRYGYAIVGDVSGTSITFGSETVFNAYEVQHVSIGFDEGAGKVVIAYEDWGNSNYGTAIVGTVSGTSISFGSEVVYESARSQHPQIVYDSDAQKTVICFSTYGDSEHGYGIVGTVSGTSISFGSKTKFESAVVSDMAIAYDSNASKVVVAYRDAGNSNYGTAAVGTVSGTSISFGTPVVWNSAAHNHTGAAYDANVKKILITYRDNGNSNYGTVVSGTVSGTSISFDSEFVFNNSNSGQTGVGYDASSKKAVIAYLDNSTTSGDAVVYQAGGSVPNLTAENYIGMSRGILKDTNQSEAVGTPSVYATTEALQSDLAYDSASGKMVLAWRDSNNTNGYGKAVVITVSGTTLSYGTPVTFNAASTRGPKVVFDSTNNKIVIAYRDDGNSNYSTAIVGTVSGTSISFGTPVVYKSANNSGIAAVYDPDNSKVVVGSAGTGGGNYDVSVGTVSGTSISFGSSTTIGFAYSGEMAYDEANNKVIVALHVASSQGDAYVGTVSGTSITFGSANNFRSANVSEIHGVVYDSANSKIILCYQANDLYAQVGTVSGTSMTFGSEVIVNATGSQADIGYDSLIQKPIVVYRDNGNTFNGTLKVGTVSGTSISFGSATVYETGDATQNAIGFDSGEGKSVISYSDGDNSSYGTAVAYQAAGSYQSRGEVASGQPAAIDIIGSVNDIQESLTSGEKYYVQTDGTLSTTAGSPSVLAGTAISATKLVVKT